MKKIFNMTWVLVVAFLLQSALGCAANPKILVFAKTKGYFHESIPTGMKTIMKVCMENGIDVDTSRDAAVFTYENLKQYRALVFLNTTGDILDNGQQEAFIKYIQSGGGFVGVHAATDTEYDWPWYNKLIGAYFLSHPAEQQEAVIDVVDKANPATAMLPEKWKRTDEWYNFRDISTDIHVLAYLDETSYTGGKNSPKHPFIWYHEYEGGRAFYTGVGHREDNFSEPLLQQHLLGAIQWAGKIR